MKKKIETLTQSQIDRFPEFVDRWLNIGLSTQPSNRPVAEAALRKCYELSNLKQPGQIIWTTSPLAGFVLVGILKDESLMKKISHGVNAHPASVMASIGDSVGDSVWASVGDSVMASVGDSVMDSVRASVRASVRDPVRVSVWASIRDSVWASVGDSVMASIGDSVGDSVMDSVRASVRASVWASIRDSVWASVWASVGASVRDSVRSVYRQNLDWFYYLGQFSAGNTAYFEYFREVCNLIEETEKAIPLWDLSKHSSWIYPYQNLAVICEKPEKISVNSSGKIHCEAGPCVLYRDGFAVYGLNGVRVPKEIVETPAHDLSAELILKERNAEIRREIVRKIGIERVCHDLNAKTIDKMGDYELLLLDLQDGRYRPYLKMLNPSILTHHIEGVHPDCKTVKQALAWRNGTKKYIQPEVLT